MKISAIDSKPQLDTKLNLGMLTQFPISIHKLYGLEMKSRP
jgi:hypothetical protein